MQIDWFTVGAQVVNFLVLVLLLKRFLYQPIINAMERREQALLQSRKQAETQIEEAEKQTAFYQQKLQEIEQQKENLLMQARLDAESEKEKLLQQLRLEVAEVDQHWRAEVERDKQSFLTDARQKMGREIIQLSRKILADVADVELQQQILKLFLHKLLNLSDNEKQKIKSALADLTQAKLKLLSSFEVSDAQRQEIINAINLQVSTAIELELEIVPELLCGLKLQIPGGELEWSAESYLAQIEDDLSISLSAPAASR